MSDLEEETSSQYEQTNNKIVLKVTDKGNLVQVSLGSDPEKGTEFKVGANNIELSADEVIELLSGGTINLSAGNGITIEAPNFQLSKEIIKILTKNFTLDEEGNVTAANITITGGSIKIVSDSNEPLIEMQYGTGDNMVTAGLSPEGVYYTNVTDTWEERSTSGLMTKYRTAVSTEHKNGNMADKHDKTAYIWRCAGLGDNRRVPCGRNCLPCCKWQGDKSLLQRAGEQLFRFHGTIF